MKNKVVEILLKVWETEGLYETEYDGRVYTFCMYCNYGEPHYKHDDDCIIKSIDNLEIMKEYIAAEKEKQRKAQEEQERREQEEYERYFYNSDVEREKRRLARNASKQKCQFCGQLKINLIEHQQGSAKCLEIQYQKDIDSGV